MKEVFLVYVKSNDSLWSERYYVAAKGSIEAIRKATKQARRDTGESCYAQTLERLGEFLS